MDEDIDKTHAELAGFAQPAARLRQAIDKDEFALYCQPILAQSLPLGKARTASASA